MDNVKAKKSLGQNFLKDENILKKIVNSFPLEEGDLVIEIGPGKGALTKYLAQSSADLLCYEVDERMASFLLPYESSTTKIIFDDFLKRNLMDDITKDYNHIYIIANIPYYITTPIIEHVLQSGIFIDGMTLLVQKEVALRFTATPKSKDYGYFTVYLKHFFEAKKLFDVPAHAFTPPPKVTSSVVQFVRKENIVSLDVAAFQSFLKQCFSKKRKTLKNNLKMVDWSLVCPVLQKYGFGDSVRAEELSYEVFVELFFVIQKS